MRKQRLNSYEQRMERQGRLPPDPRTRPGRRSANARCARCGQRRKMWLDANLMMVPRVLSKNVAGEGKVCWICVVREVDPTWRPGKPLPPQIAPVSI